MEEIATSLENRKKKETRGGLLDAKTSVLHGSALLYLTSQPSYQRRGKSAFIKRGSAVMFGVTYAAWKVFGACGCCFLSLLICIFISSPLWSDPEFSEALGLSRC